MVRKELLPYFKEENNLIGSPQKYKTIQLYPIKLFDNDMISAINFIFGRSKNEYINSITDIKLQKQAYKISYLKTLLTFLQLQINPNGVEVAESIKYLFSQITQIDYSKIQLFIMGKQDFVLAKDLIYDKNEIMIIIDGNVYNESDFDNIREIVLEQNGISVKNIDEFHAELEIVLQQNKSNMDNITFSDDIFSFISLLQKTIKEIEDYTLYQFKKQYERVRLIEDCRLLYPLEISGKVKSKNGIPLYNSHIKEKGRYDSILISMEEFEKNDIFKATKEL